MRQTSIELTILLFMAIKPSPTVPWSKILNTLTLESFDHFDCTIYWRENTSYFRILDFKSVDAKFQSVTFPTTVRNGSLESTDPLSSILTTTGLSAVFAFLYNHNEVEDFLLMTVNFYKRNKLSKELWSPYFFIFLNSSELSRGQIEEYAKRFDLSSEVYLILLKNDLTIKSIYEFYHIKNVTIVQDITFDLTLRDHEGKSRLSFWKVVHKTSRRSNFHREIIVGVNVDHPDYEIATKYKHDNTTTNKTEFESGFEVEEFYFLRDALNFSEAAFAWPTYLRLGSNGTLTGLAVPINTELADMGIGATEFLEYRFAAIDGITYLHPTFYNEILAFFKQPAASSIRDIFFLTFSSRVWAVLAGTWLLIILSLVISIHCLKRADLNSLDPLDSQLSQDVLLFAASALCQQGWYTSPSSPSVKIIFLIGTFSALLLFIAYSASLVSILSVEVIPVRHFHDLLHNKFDILSDSDIPTSMAVVQSLEDEGILDKVPRDRRNVDVSDYLGKLFQTKIAIVSMSDSFYQVVAKRGYDAQFICSTMSKVLLSPRPAQSSMFVKRGSALREYFNSKILLMKERGVMSILRQHYIRDTSVQCLKRNSGYHQQLGIKDVFTAYVILGSGMSMAIIFGCVERMLFIQGLVRP